MIKTITVIFGEKYFSIFEIFSEMEVFVHIQLCEFNLQEEVPDAATCDRDINITFEHLCCVYKIFIDN